MVFGTAKFKCDNCGKTFVSTAMEWNATFFLTPMPCPKCVSLHTYPIGFENLGGLLGPNPVYRKIWKSMDKNKP